MMNLGPIKDRRLGWLLALGVPAVFFLAQLFLYPSLHWSGTRTLPRDTHWFHFRMFHFVVQMLRETGRFPDWYPAQGGGSWIEPLANNTLLLAPYRVIGYLFGILFPAWSTVALHKFVFLILGRLTFFTGCGLFLLEAVRKKDRSIFEVSGALSWLVISPLAVAVIHQEQALGTILLVPWIAWAWLTGRIWLAALLAGFSLNHHYPHLLLFYGICLALAKWAESPKLPVFPKPESLKPHALIAGFFFAGVLPLIYSYLVFSGKLQSQFREQTSDAGLSLGSYAQYLKMCLLQEASLQPTTLFDYLGIHVSPIRPAFLDDRTLAVGPIAWIA
ncbi:MAG: hypothetical protein AAB425_09975, partial [Bdellovibrionota bacterium]